MSYRLGQLTYEDRERLVQHIKEDTKKLKNEYRTKMYISKEPMIGDKEVYDALLANSKQEYETYHVNEIQAITDEENRRTHTFNSWFFIITVIVFLAIYALIVVGLGYWLFEKINSSLQSTSLSNSVISAIKIAFVFVYPTFLAWATFNPFISKIYRWEDNTDAWEEFYRKRDAYAEFHAEEKLIEYRRKIS